MSNELLKKILKKEEIVRKKVKKESLENVKNFSWVISFAGKAFSQQLAQNQDILKKNIIDFRQVKNEKGEFVENKIKEIENNAENKRLIAEGRFPIIWFKNLEEIINGSAMEKALLPVFDPQQNTELFNEKVDLSKYILIATSFSYDISQISSPLISRLDFINVEEIKTKKFFLDENFFSVLFVSLLIGLITLYIIAFDSSRFEVEKITNKHKNEQ